MTSKISKLITIVFLCFTFGCANKVPEPKFYTVQYGEPGDKSFSADVFIIYNNDTIEVTRINGSTKQIPKEDYEAVGILPKTHETIIDALGGWYAGSGAYLYIKKDNEKNIYSIYEKEEYEGMEGTAKWKFLLSIDEIKVEEENKTEKKRNDNKFIETFQDTKECIIGKWVPEDDNLEPYRIFEFREINNRGFYTQIVMNRKGGEIIAGGGWAPYNNYFLGEKPRVIELVGDPVRSRERLIIEINYCNRLVIEGEYLYIKK